LEYQTTPRIRRFIGFKLSGEEKPELGRLKKSRIGINLDIHNTRVPCSEYTI